MNIFQKIVEGLKSTFSFPQPVEQKPTDVSQFVQKVLDRDFIAKASSKPQADPSWIIKVDNTIKRPEVRANFEKTNQTLTEDFFNRLKSTFSYFKENPGELTPFTAKKGFLGEDIPSPVTQFRGSSMEALSAGLMKNKEPEPKTRAENLSKLAGQILGSLPYFAGANNLVSGSLANYNRLPLMGKVGAGALEGALAVSATTPGGPKERAKAGAQMFSPTNLALGGAIPVFGGLVSKSNISKAIASKLEQQAPNAVQKTFQSLDKSKRLSYLAGKFTDKKMTEISAAKAYSEMEGLTNSVEEFVKNVDPKTKVGILDYLATPSTVMSKIGLLDEFKGLRKANENYLKQLPEEINKITQWSKMVSPESNNVIFNVLDGKGDIRLLDASEKQVVSEVRNYLQEWAVKLGLPKEKRISNYITHIFSKDFGGEFPDDIAKKIEKKVAGSVYDPFLQKRGDVTGYKTDTWAAMDAYVKRALRKVNMDPALEKIKKASEDLELSQFNYVKQFVDRVNLRPTDLDNLLDNSIKASPIGYKFGSRPTADVTRKARQMVYRGLLGLNPGSAVKNLSQGANTYAELGERYTLKGYIQVAKNFKNFVKGADTELHEVGVLENGFIEDRTLNATKEGMRQLDEGLFYMFNFAEKINRGAAYWGAKAKALDKGMGEEKAIEYAKAIVRKTQFAFGSIDTPVALQSDIMKTLFQFQNYGIKQIEFLGGKVKAKEWAGLARYIGSSLAFVYSIGKVLGMEPKDMIPSIRIGTPPTLQLGKGAVEMATGNIEDGKKDLIRGGMSYIPAGGQIKKSFDGLQNVMQAGEYNPSGTQLKYPTGNPLQTVLFGQNATPQADQYYKNPSPLGEKQTELYKNLVSSGVSPQDAYNSIIATRQNKKDLKTDINEAGGNGFDLFSWFKKKTVGSGETSGSREDLLLDSLSKQKDLTEKQTEIRDIFNSGLSKDKIEILLEKRGLGTYEEGALVMMKTLPIESGARGEYLKAFLTGLNNNQYQQAIVQLAENEILTTGVTSKWLDDGVITKEQKKQLDGVIKNTKGTTSTSSSGGMSWKSLPKISVSRGSAPKTVKLDVPKAAKIPWSAYESALKNFKMTQANMATIPTPKLNPTRLTSRLSVPMPSAGFSSPANKRF